LGSVLNHVLMHQTVIGQEAKLQMQMAGEEADVVIACFGGGSNFGGLALPYVLDRFAGKGPRIVAIEPSACPTLTKGKFTYDYGDTAKLTPLVKMFTLGHDFMPPGIHAGGLRYHGASPLISHLVKLGHIEAKAYTQLPVFEAAIQFARTEGILPAPESAHAIRGAIDEALAAKEAGKGKVILFGLSGHGHFDLSAYENFISGKLVDYEYPGREIAEAIAGINSGV
jgi:tryptophan synthase beta chain